MIRSNDSHTMNHATVKIGDYTIPLIGIPPEATEDKCETCGKLFHLSELAFVDGKMICKDCNERTQCTKPAVP